MHNCQIVILAAGKGTRMNSELPKVLVGLAGKPLISHLLYTVDTVSERPPIIVVGYEQDLVKHTLGSDYRYVVQEEQKGTAHAAGCALHEVDAEHMLVLYGDMPFISSETLRALTASHVASTSPLTLATATVPDFSDWRAGFERFGRIIREDEEIVAIREFKDATESERAITEVNPAYFMFDTQWVRGHIERINADNAQGELYLTDLVGIARSEGNIINSLSIDPREALGANTREELEVLERIGDFDKATTQE